jgi:hypothetical protein
MQRLQEVRAFISEDEYEKRKAAILATAGKDFFTENGSYNVFPGPSVSQITTDVGKLTIAKEESNVQASADDEDLNKIVVVYMIDSGRKCTNYHYNYFNGQKRSPNVNCFPQDIARAIS